MEGGESGGKKGEGRICPSQAALFLYFFGSGQHVSFLLAWAWGWGATFFILSVECGNKLRFRLGQQEL